MDTVLHGRIWVCHSFAELCQERGVKSFFTPPGRCLITAKNTENAHWQEAGFSPFSAKCENLYSGGDEMERKKQDTFLSRCGQVEAAAQRLWADGVAWTTFFRDLLGPEGLVRKLFSTPEQLAEFERTDTYRKIQEMLATLRRLQEGRLSHDEPLTVITIRVPRSLHEALAEEAHALKTSINRLCISKLAQIIDTRFVPPLRHLDRNATPVAEETADPLEEAKE